MCGLSLGGLVRPPCQAVRMLVFICPGSTLETRDFNGRYAAIKMVESDRYQIIPGPESPILYNNNNNKNNNLLYYFFVCYLTQDTF